MNTDNHNRQNSNVSFIIDFKQADVNGNNVLDDVYLIGTRPLGPGSYLINNIKIIIRDGNNGEVHEIIPQYNKGYNPTIFLGDFTNNNIREIMISISSGSTSGEIYAYIYSFKDNVKRLLFDFEQFNELQLYNIVFQDNFKIFITNQKEYVKDIAEKNQDYKDYIYNLNGTLKKPITGRISPLISLIPIPSNDNAFYELNTKQRLLGYYSADVLGELTTRLRFENNQFVIVDDEVDLF